MAVKTITAVLDLDSSKLTVKMREVAGAIKQFKTDIEATDKSLNRAWSNMNLGGVSAVRKYTEALNTARNAQKDMRATQNEFLLGLQKEFETMGLSASQMRDYQAASLGLEKQTRTLREAIDEKARSLAMAAASERSAIEADEAATMASRTRQEAIDNMVTSLRVEMDTMGMSREQLLSYQAAEIGATQETRALIFAITEKANTIRMAAESEEKYALTAAETVSGLRSYSEATVAATGHTKSFGRAVYEVNVLMHELSSGRLRQAISSFSILLNSLGMAIGATLGITLTIGLLYGLSKPIEEAAKHMQELKNQSQELGVSVEWLQKMAVASDLLGVKTDKLVGGIGRLDQAFARARAGSKQQADGFHAVGVNTNKNYTQEQLMDGVIAGWSKLENGPRKVTVAMELFGRSGKELIPVLNELATHQKEVNDAMEKYGVVNPKAVQEGVELAHHFDEAKIAAQGFGNTLLATFGPTLNKALESFSAFVGRMTQALKSDGAITALKQIGSAIKTLGDVISTAMQYLPTFAAALFAMFGLAALAPVFASITTAIEDFTAYAAFAGTGATALKVGMGAVEAAGVGLVAGLEAIVGALGGPVGIAIIAAVGLFNLLSNAEKAAGNAAKDFKTSQEEAASALQGAIGFANQYKLSTSTLSGVLIGVATNSANASKNIRDQANAHDQAAQAAMRQANAERILAAQRLMDAAATIQQRAAKDQKSVHGFGFGVKKFIDKHGADVAAGLANMSGDNVDPDYTNYQNDLKQQASVDQGATGQYNMATGLYRAASDLLKQPLTNTGNNGVGTTDGDPGKTTHAPKGKSPAQRLQEAINKMSDKDIGIGTFLASDDPVAAARAQAQATVADQYGAEGKFAGVDPKGALAKLFVDKSGQNAAFDSAKNSFKEMMSGVTKATEEAAAAQQNYDDQASTSEKKVNDYTAKMGELRENFAKMVAILPNGTQLLKEWDDAVARGTLATGHAAWADIAKGYQDKATALEDQLSGGRTGAEKSYNTAHNKAQTDLDAANAFLSANPGADFIKGYIKDIETYMADLDKLHAMTPLQKLSQDWADTTTQMQDHTKSWAEDFANKVEAGKFKFKDFIGSILHDWGDTMLKAALSKTVNPFLDMIGGGLNTLTGGLLGSVGLGTKADGSQANPFFVKSADGVGGAAAQAVTGQGGLFGSGGMLSGIGSWIGKAASGIGSFFGNMFSGVGSFLAGLFHTGGEVGTTFNPRSVHPMAFMGAPRFHGGIKNLGLRPDEVPAILQKGESVYTAQQVAGMRGGSKVNGAPPVTVNLHNESGTPMGGDSGGTRFDGEKYVVDIVLNHLSQPGPLRNALRSKQ